MPFFLLALLPIALALNPVHAQEPATRGIESGDAQPRAELVARFVAAFNAQDIDAMSALLSEDAAWYYVEGDQVVVQDADRAGIRASLASYFESFPDVRSEIEQTLSLEPFVSVVERVHWQKDGIARNQASIAVYHFDGDRISAVWYFPAVSD